MEERGSYREKLIISADDFGLSSSANEKILALAGSGKIDRVAVIVSQNFNNNLSSDIHCYSSECHTNVSVFKEDALKLLKYPVKIDIHFTLPGNIKNRRGIFRRSLFFLAKYFSGKVSAPVVELEWERQIKKFQELFGKNPDGINSHEYIHFLPAYFQAVLNLAKEFNIPCVRFGKNGLVKSNNNVYRILKTFWKKDNKFFISSNLGSSDYLSSLDWTRNVKRFLKNLPEGKTEIVCHPERKKEYEIIKKYF
jgi:predicted glycoside hydrolase/deacetylase ChbG (UPF0249 family)